MSLKHDALQHRRCKTCAMWHNPDGLAMGWCVWQPGVAFLVAQMPQAPAIVRPEIAAQQGPQPQVLSAALPKGPDDGCFQYLTRETRR